MAEERQTFYADGGERQTRRHAHLQSPRFFSTEQKSLYPALPMIPRTRQRRQDPAASRLPVGARAALPRRCRAVFRAKCAVIC